MEVGKEESVKISGKNREKVIRNFLVDMRKRLLAEIAARIFPNSPPTFDIGDVVDQAGDERDRELVLLLTDREKEKIHIVDEALEKLDNGTYGICEECGDPIAPGRLKAVPLAKFCITCQARREKEIKLRGKEEAEIESPDVDLLREVWEEEG